MYIQHNVFTNWKPLYRSPSVMRLPYRESAAPSPPHCRSSALSTFCSLSFSLSLSPVPGQPGFAPVPWTPTLQSEPAGTLWCLILLDLFFSLPSLTSLERELLEKEIVNEILPDPSGEQNSTPSSPRDLSASGEPLRSTAFPCDEPQVRLTLEAASEYSHQKADKSKWSPS